MLSINATFLSIFDAYAFSPPNYPGIFVRCIIYLLMHRWQVMQWCIIITVNFSANIEYKGNVYCNAASILFIITGFSCPHWSSIKVTLWDPHNTITYFTMHKHHPLWACGDFSNASPVSSIIQLTCNYCRTAHKGSQWQPQTNDNYLVYVFLWHFCAELNFAWQPTSDTGDTKPLNFMFLTFCDFGTISHFDRCLCTGCTLLVNKSRPLYLGHEYLNHDK